MAVSPLEQAAVVAIIPARGGSKGLTGKNLLTVGGVPLIVRAVRSARAASLIDAVYVSTDDAAIAAAARAAGAEIIERPHGLSDDMTSSEAVLLHVLDTLPVQPRVIAFLQATSPFIDPRDLDSAVARLDGADDDDVVFAACVSHAFLWKKGPTGAVGVNHDKSYRLRRQDIAQQFRETGAFYVMRASGFRESGSRFFGRVGIAEVPTLTAIDIDSLDDLAAARSIAGLIDEPESIAATAVVTDFDGVHTDDRVHFGADGAELVTVSRSDGMGIELLRNAGVPVLILSKETNPVVSARAAKLRVDVRQGVDDKARVLAEWLHTNGLEAASVAYLGNDVNDLGCMSMVGWPIAVADAHPRVLNSARVVLARSGGHGAVRELADRTLSGMHPSIDTPGES